MEVYKMISMLLAVLQQGGSGDAVINIDSNAQNLILKDLYEQTRPPAGLGTTVTFIVDGGVEVSSALSTVPSMDTGVWAVGVNLFLVNNSLFLRGAGGNGSGPNPGAAGGTALLVQSPINIDNASGNIAGGGGGGAGTDSWADGGDDYQAGGGGGAGGVVGSGHSPTPGVGRTVQNGASGTSSTGGAGGTFVGGPGVPFEVIPGGGAGGDLGMPGGDASDVLEPGSTDNVGGAAGFAIDGVSLVTFTNAGTITGPTTN